jgi:hypothetical protein
MSALKIESKTVESVAENANTNSSLRASASVAVDKNDLRESLKADSNQIIPGQSATLDPHTLKQMYLLGKLTQGQLAHELKKYNDVVADAIIKEGKHSQVQTIDYREVGRASVSNPGADFKPDSENKFSNNSNPKDAKSAKKEANQTDDTSKKRELEKKEVKLKNDQNLSQIRRLNNFNDAQIEQKNQHATRELKKREEEQQSKLMDLDSDTSLDKLTKKATGRERLSKNLAAEIKAELEKLRAGPSQSSLNNSSNKK